MLFVNYSKQAGQHPKVIYNNKLFLSFTFLKIASERPTEKQNNL